MATTLSPPATVSSRPGRRRSTSRARLEAVSLDLFTRHGFDAVSVDDIAAAAGIGRRTFFRYFPSKNDAVWGDFDALLVSWRDWFDRCPPGEPVLAAVRRAVVAFNAYGDEGLALHRQRMRIILDTPTLQAHSTLRYREWRDVVAAFVARRTAARPEDLLPRVVGQVALGCALAAYEDWLQDEAVDTDAAGLARRLSRALSVLDERVLTDGGTA